ncbi:MAG: SDR family NAD(P)-dependent oxidoreductase [Anaerolineales bacterium]
MFNFENQVVLITGASGNLGRATARAFARAGARVAILERDPKKALSALPRVNAFAPDAVDVTDADSVAQAVAAVMTHYGRIDCLVNTVGGYQAGKPLHETSLETWQQMFDLNARSVFVVCRAVLPILLSQGSGKIVNVAAAAALKGGDANSSAYGAAKTAVARLTESMAAEYKRSGINVNAVLPAILDTPQNRSAMPNADFSTWVTPEAMADVILFLCSPLAAPIHGVLLPVFGTR